MRGSAVLASSPMAATMPRILGSPGRTLMQSAARGAALIGAMVVVGIVLLQVVDDGGGGGGGGGGNGGVTPVDTTDDTTPDDTTPAGDARPPGEVRVNVYNASGVAGAAGDLTNTLRGNGYNMGTPGDDPVQQAGTVVACQPDYAADADPLLLAVTAAGVANGAVGDFPADRTDLPEIDTANCVVILGT
jgi:hypothetical protein